MSTKRIYVVKSASGDGKARLIEASNKTQAIGFAARTHFAANLAGQQELVELVKGGAEVERATEEAA